MTGRWTTTTSPPTALVLVLLALELLLTPLVPPSPVLLPVLPVPLLVLGPAALAPEPGLSLGENIPVATCTPFTLPLCCATSCATTLSP